jgi:ketosteroid isomerase-like protein
MDRKRTVEGGSMHADKAALIRALFDAYLANDRGAVERMLADDFRFTSPYDHELDKATYFARCWRDDNSWIERHVLERIMTEGDAAYVTYLCIARGGKSFRNTELMLFAGGRVQRIEVYFGANYQDGVFQKQAES